MKWKSKYLPAALLLAAIPRVHAGELSLGIAAGGQSSQFLDQDERTFVVPVISYEGERFSFQMDTAAWMLAGHATEDFAWRVRLVGTARLFEKPEDVALLEERDSTLEAGIEFGVRGHWGSLNFETVADTLGKHGGFEATLGYSYEWALTDRLILTPTVWVTFQDKQLADYYFGVRSSEIRADRPDYHPGEGGTVNAGILTIYALSERWSLLGVLEHQTLNDELANSPLVDSESSVTAAIGAMYRF